MYKVITFCPNNSIDKVISAMAEAGAGNVGNYSHCAFITKGEGNWFSGKGSNPTIGQVGKISREKENKIEMVCPKNKLKSVVEAIKRSHPYEEPEINVYELVAV
ncbi:divalent cation tolerance protein CutA [Candidatus Dojkabacteria bacterium]|nr:divalent cation tolerance protein CutA [Candidatus Dojkabacteria bacterium]